MLLARGYTLDTLPPLTAAQKANLSRLAALPDSEIDTSDIPELSDAQWQTAVRGRFHKPTKTVVTTVLVGLWNRPRTAVCHCASLSSGISLVSISLSGRAASLDRLAFCAAVNGGNVSNV